VVRPLRRPRSREALGYAGLALACLLLFGWLTGLVMTGRTEGWDNQVMLSLAQDRRPWLSWWMTVLGAVGSGAVEAPLVLLLLYGLVSRRRVAEARWYGVAVLSGWALYAVAKLVVHRTRPHVISYLMHGAGWYSYPSGHSMLGPLVFGLGAIVWAVPWRQRTARWGILGAATLLSAAIGISRVYVGVHYPTDAIGGLLLGTGWSAMWLYWWERREAGPVAKSIG
jgi:undecaprenyl-diphosphatase